MWYVLVAVISGIIFGNIGFFVGCCFNRSGREEALQEDEMLLEKQKDK